MRYKKSELLIVIIFLTGILVSCSSSRQPPVTLDEKYVNQQILLIASENKIYTTSDSILLEMKYNSINEIEYPGDYFLRLFENTKAGWMEILRKTCRKNAT
jgi:hypothetical protein